MALHVHVAIRAICRDMVWNQRQMAVSIFGARFPVRGWVILGSFLGSLLACFVAFHVCALMIRVRDFCFWPVVLAVPPTEMKRRKSSKKNKKIQKSAVVENCDE